VFAREGHELSRAEADRARLRSSGIRQSICWRSLGAVSQTNGHDASCPARLLSHGHNDRHTSRWQRTSLAVIWCFSFTAAFLATGCSHGHRIKASPESVYRESFLKLRHGDLVGALALVNSVPPQDSPANSEWRWRFDWLKAEILLRQGSYDESLILLQPSLPAELESSDIAVRRKMTQGAASSFLGAYENSERFLNDAEALARAQHPDLLDEIALRKGTLAFLRGDMARAQIQYKQALEVSRQQHDAFLEAASLGSLGLVATAQEHYDESIDWNRSALQLARRVEAQDSIAYTLGNMGWSYIEMGDYDEALALFVEAKQAAQKAGTTSAELDWVINIGNVDLARGDYDSAEREYQNAITLANKLHDDSAKSECFENLALVSLERNQVSSAEKYNELVAPLVRAHSDAVVSLIIKGRILVLKRDYEEASNVFRSVIDDRDAPTALRWESQARLAEVFSSEGKQAAADREFRSAIGTITNARQSIKTEELRLSFLSTAIAFYSSYIEFLISQGRAEEALQVAEVSRAQTLAEGLGISSKISFPLANFKPTAVARRFGATVLFYWLGEKHSHLWAVTPSSISHFTLSPASELEPLIKSYREALLGPWDALETSNTQGIKLYELLVGPAQKLIVPGSRVIILPDGGLYGLNFETLLNPKPRLHYWIEDVVIANANSLVLLAASASKLAAKAKKLLLVGDPISPSTEFPDLPQAAIEMADVERYFAASDRTVLSRQQATATAYLDSKPAQYSFIHFVAHGTASRASPLDSAVILSRQGDSYKLYARDIVRQPLQANLVTISACHGAGERTYSGEGLVGLAWAFLRAGAHGVIAALWEVNDNSTPELMDDLYAEIQKGSAPDAALHHAKLKLLNSGTVYQKPFYWAPFEIYLGH
jgi:CHAT domain-containing protein/Tfp pilus assembly protein PilF